MPSALPLLLAGGRVGQTVGFSVKFAPDVGDGELQRASKFSAGPVQRIEPWAVAGVDARHLLYDNFGIGVNVEGASFQENRALQSFQKGQVLGNVVILPANPLRDFEFAVANAADYDPNTGRSRISQRTTVDISN